MKCYLDYLQYILDNGIKTKNRTGVDTIACSGYMLTHDMKEGFPLLTTKKMGLKMIASELEMFINGITDKRWLQERNNHIWDEWCNPQKVPYANDEISKAKMAAEPDLGKIYGYNWVCFEGDSRHIVEVKRRVIPKNIERIFPIFALLPFTEGPLTSNAGYEFNILNKYTEAGHSYCDIQFVHTGAINKKVRYDAALDGRVLDTYEESYFGVGYLGDLSVRDEFIKKYGDELYQKMYKVWAHMLDRCYNKDNSVYKYYGAKGIFVESAWLCLSNFLTDVCQLPNFPALLRCPTEYELDKDYYGANAYSKTTCVWLMIADNVLYRTSKPFYAMHKDGTKELFISKTEAKTKLKAAKISACLNGDRKTSGGYTFKYIEESDILYRYQLPHNQLKTVIETIKKDPTSRRLIISAWNPNQLNEMALPPCVIGYEFLCYPENNTIDIIWAQRSVDSFLGLPFDFAEAALFLMLVCKETGYQPGKVIGMLGNCHIYENCIDQVKEQLTRTPHKLPTVEITNWTDIWNWHYTDFELKDYTSEGKLTATVAV